MSNHKIYSQKIKKYRIDAISATNNNDYNFAMYKLNKYKLKYIASCGHENNVSWQNFKCINQGINCPKCVNKNTVIKTLPKTIT